MSKINDTKPLLMTHSLLSAWQWSFLKDDGMDEFMSTLRREPLPQTKAMLDGIRFENMARAHCEGAAIPIGHEWTRALEEIKRIVGYGAWQVKTSKRMSINGVDFLLYGIADVIGAGTIYDLKFTSSYRPPKYVDSTQHPMYFELLSTATRFDYIISNGEDVNTETYYRHDIEPVETTIKQFMGWLEEMDLVDCYATNWRSKY